MALDFSEAKLTPFAHQIEDTEMLVNQPYVFITSEMRTGKTKIVNDAAYFLYRLGLINRVTVIVPSPIKDVWYDPDPDFGEIAKHHWDNVNVHVTEYHSRLRCWSAGPSKLPFNHKDWDGLKWIVSNYEFIRSEERLLALLPYITRKTLLVFDESSAIKHADTVTSEACMRLRYVHLRKMRKGKQHYTNTWQPRANRVVLLNGTPFDTPMDLFNQGNTLHPGILECRYKSNFKSRYAVMGGFQVTKQTWDKKTQKKKDIQISTEIIDWQNLDDLSARFKPHTVRRLQADCLDLPPKLDPVTIQVTMSKTTWNQYYKPMRDQLAIEFENGLVTTAAQAIVKVMRLSQITSGYVGGVENLFAGDPEDDYTDDDLPPWIERTGPVVEVQRTPVPPTREIGREKLDILHWFWKSRYEAEPNFKMIAWCRFKPEMRRMVDEMRKLYPEIIVAEICGGQKKADRLAAFKLLHPATAPKGPVFVGGTYGTGAKGLNCTAAHTYVNCSYDYSNEKFLQSGDRVYGPGQTHPVAPYEMVAVGPNGQKTVDHIIVKARRRKHEIMEYTVKDWVRLLREE